MMAQTSRKVGGYSLKNLELKFEAVDSQEFLDEVKSLYSSTRTLIYEHITLRKTSEWDRDSTVDNENFDLPRNKTSNDSEE